ncbi:transcriptional regulator, CarD family [Oscillibacter sp. PC13]|uniref:CarD family transcriptional regulator n=1 Tax=Oscillibacter sp. PC13 TaxID=1855299 RepID=UPI0008E77F96|nr:CarD family transcriptional regulator [Oscillibacter sp. PC13]SFP12345.1 transcriptional regulator, CarD family [Oscillibacter sp. PC13]
MFSVGDLVVHPMHGAGIINAIVEEKVAGSTQDYYVFKMPVGGLLLKIPTANSHSIGLRTIIAPAEAERLLNAIPSLELEQTSNWNKRYRENMDRLKSGNLYEVARVIKALMLREQVRGLSTGERKMLHSAKQILLSELVLSQKTSYQDMEDRVDAAMLCSPAV